MKDHFNTMKVKVEVVYQRIIAIAGNTTNVHSKIEPITTYGGEVWDLNKG